MADVYAGGSGLALLCTPDPGVSIVLQKKAEAAYKLAAQRDKNLAALIANNLGKVLGGKRK